MGWFKDTFLGMKKNETNSIIPIGSYVNSSTTARTLKNTITTTGSNTTMRIGYMQTEPYTYPSADIEKVKQALANLDFTRDELNCSYRMKFTLEFQIADNELAMRSQKEIFAERIAEARRELEKKLDVLLMMEELERARQNDKPNDNA